MNIVISLTKESRLQVQTKSNNQEDEPIYLSTYLQRNLKAGNNVLQELAKTRQAVHAAQSCKPQQAKKIGLAASQEMFHLLCAISTYNAIKLAEQELKRIGIPIPTKAS